MVNAVPLALVAVQGSTHTRLGAQYCEALNTPGRHRTLGVWLGCGATWPPERAHEHGMGLATGFRPQNLDENRRHFTVSVAC